MDVAAGLGADVTRHSRFRPAEVVDAGHVDEDVEPLGVAEVRARLDDPRGVDDERGLTVGLERLDDATNAEAVAARVEGVREVREELLVRSIAERSPR